MQSFLWQRLAKNHFSMVLRSIFCIFCPTRFKTKKINFVFSLCERSCNQISAFNVLGLFRTVKLNQKTWTYRYGTSALRYPFEQTNT